MIEDLNVYGSNEAPIAVVCDSPSESVYHAGAVMPNSAMKVFSSEAKAIGLTREDFYFITCSPPIPEEHASTDGRVNNYVAPYTEDVRQLLAGCPNLRLVIYLGKTAGRVVEGKPIKITKVHGVARTITGIAAPVLPLLSPSNVLRRPETAQDFSAGFRQLMAIREANWDVAAVVQEKTEGKYRWVTDLQFLLDNPPKVVAMDTETDGLKWMTGAKPLLATLSWEEWQAVAVPLDIRYWPELGEEGIDRLRNQFKALMENPDVYVVGFNLKFDLHILHNIGINVANWYADGVQLAFAADENMQSKTLAECCRRWVPEMASYSDEFDRTIDKSRMLEVSRELVLPYACGDAEVTFVLVKRLVAEVRRDAQQWATFVHIQMPALRMFVGMERRGLRIDTEALANLETTLGEQEAALYTELIREVPAEIRLRYYDEKKPNCGLSFTRDAFTADVLFSPEGFNLTPLVFTDSTKDRPPEERVPSTSGKDHLPFFADDCPFVQRLIEYQKLQKMRSTYVGKASAIEQEEIPRLKNGNLPKRIITRLNKAGITVDKEGGYHRGRFRVRTRPMTLTVGEHTWQVRHRIPLLDGATLYETTEGRVFTETWTEPTGFWQYLTPEGRIHPSTNLHGTNTGRTSSREPNSQNFPKRGALASAFRRIFIPTDGYVFLEIDLSQAELRIAAWMANEPTMLRIYREGGDIHASTAAAVMGIAPDEFNRWKKSEEPLLDHANDFPGAGEYLRDLNPGARATVTVKKFLAYKRQQAKAVNFGFLYGMWWRKFKLFAKTDYQLDLTDDDAKNMRKAFFRLYPRLEDWHTNTRELARAQGYVRALHGSLRRLPSIYSNDEAIVAMTERQAINAPVQRFGSDLALMGIVEFAAQHQHGDTAYPVAFIHDAGVCEVRREMALTVARQIKNIVENQPLEELFGIRPPLPLLADVQIGENLSAMEEVHLPDEEQAAA